MDWEKYWGTHPAKVDRKKYLEQVGKTVNGRPISARQLQRLISDISHNLELQAGDVLLDLCCGNGLITHCLAGECHKVVGVDYSEPLLTIARRDHQCENTTYLYASILDMDIEVISSLGPFNKVLMYECLQHFDKRDLSTLLNIVLSLSMSEVLILIGSIPDEDRRGKFYNTPKRRITAFQKGLMGRDAIGTWWTQKEISRAAKERDLPCEYLEQSEELHTAHYRFDVRLGGPRNMSAVQRDRSSGKR